MTCWRERRRYYDEEESLFRNRHRFHFDQGVIINEENEFLAESYLWTEGNPTEATRQVLHALREQLDGEQYQIVSAGTTGSARKLVGSLIGAQVVKNEITAHAVGTTTLHPDVRTILEIAVRILRSSVWKTEWR